MRIPRTFIIIILLISFSVWLTACGGGSTNTEEGVTSVSLLERNFNGDILKSQKKYNPSGTLLSTTTYTIDKISNIITVSYSGSGDKDYHYYNSEGQIVKLAVIDELDPDINGNYSSNSRETIHQTAGSFITLTML